MSIPPKLSVEPKIALARFVAGDVEAFPWMATVPVNNFVMARFAPCRMNNAARVTMNDGTPVFMEMYAFAGPDGQCKNEGKDDGEPNIGSILCRHDADNETGCSSAFADDRSNSPPIIKSAPATASTPKSEEEYNHVETPAVDKNAVVVLETCVNIRSAATARHLAGRRKIRANRPDMICRSSFWVLTVVTPWFHRSCSAFLANSGNRGDVLAIVT